MFTVYLLYNTNDENNGVEGWATADDFVDLLEIARIETGKVSS